MRMQAEHSMFFAKACEQRSGESVWRPGNLVRDQQLAQHSQVRCSKSHFFSLLLFPPRKKMEMEEAAGEKKRGMAALPVTVVSACRLQTGMRAVCVRWVL